MKKKKRVKRINTKTEEEKIELCELQKLVKKVIRKDLRNYEEIKLKI